MLLCRGTAVGHCWCMMGHSTLLLVSPASGLAVQRYTFITGIYIFHLSPPPRGKISYFKKMGGGNMVKENRKEEKGEKREKTKGKN